MRGSPGPGTPARTASRSSARLATASLSGRRLPLPRLAACRRPGWRPAIRCGLRPACRCTATNSVPTSRRTRQGSGGWYGSTSRGASSGGRGSPPAAALAARGAEGPRRTLIGLLARSRRVPRHGFAVLSDAGDEVGVVTSGAPSPTLGTPIAMAYVSGDAGGPFGIDVRGKTEPPEVTGLPFYDRRK